MQTQPETALAALTRGVMPHIARRIVRAYWIGAAEGAQVANEVQAMDTKQEIETLVKIAERAERDIWPNGERKRLDIMLDLEHAHADIPMRLDDLLAAKAGDFAHDVVGIAANLNRNTLKIENCFCPRYAA